MPRSSITIRAPRARRWGALSLLLLMGGSAACGDGAERPESSGDAVMVGERTDADREQARVRMALALLDEGQVVAGLEQLRRLDGEPGLGPGRAPSWLEPVVQRLLRRRALEPADSLLALTGPVDRRPPALQALTANLQVLRGEPEAAIGTYGAIRTDDPGLQFRVLHELASLHLMLGDPGAALARAREGLELDPEQPRLRILVATALTRSGEPERGLEELARIRPSASRWLAEAEIFLEALDRPDTAAVLLEKAHERAPQDPVVREMLGRAWLEADRPQRAARVLGPMAALPVPYGRSQALLAEAMRRLGREAVADSLEAEVRRRERIEELRRLRLEGLRLSLGGEPAAALEKFDEALELAPERADLHNDRGAALAKLERWDAAAAAFRRAADLDPLDLTSVENLARVHQRTGDEDALQRTVDEVLARRAAADAAAAASDSARASSDAPR